MAFDERDAIRVTKRFSEGIGFCHQKLPGLRVIELQEEIAGGVFKGKVLIEAFKGADSGMFFKCIGGSVTDQIIGFIRLNGFVESFQWIHGSGSLDERILFKQMFSGDIVHEQEEDIIVVQAGFLRNVQVCNKIVIMQQHQHVLSVIVMADGRVAETGTHEELLAAGGTYSRMYKLQAARYMEG